MLKMLDLLILDITWGCTVYENSFINSVGHGSNVVVVVHNTSRLILYFLAHKQALPLDRPTLQQPYIISVAGFRPEKVRRQFIQKLNHLSSFLKEIAL